MLQVLWDIAANIFASLISDLGGYGIGFATVITLGLIAAVHWHRQQVRKGNKGVQAWHLIAGGLAGITISSIVAFVGVILYFYYPLTSTKAEARLSNEPGAVITSGPTSSQGKSTVGQIIGTNSPRAVLDQGKANQYDIGVVSDGSVPIPPPAPLPWPGTEYSKLSNVELKKLALSVASQMRWLAVDWDTNRTGSSRSDLETTFYEKFRGNGAALAEEILARQSIFPPYTFQTKIMYPLALQGHFAGPNPIADAAVFLEDRARMLPDG